MEDQNDKIVDLIKKCLALSESPNEHEAARAMEKAQELLEKYNLTMRQIADRSKDSPWHDMWDLELPIDQVDWKKYLIHYVATNNFCKVVLSGRKSIHILGKQMNVSAVVERSIWIMAQLESTVWLETHNYEGSLSKLKFRNSFLWGAVNRINERLKEAQKARMTASPTTTALVVDLRKETEEFARTKFPSLVSRHRYSNNDQEAYNAGRQAGDKVSLSGANSQVYGPQLTGG